MNLTIWSVKWSVTIDLHWWCCYWRLTLDVVIPLRLKIWKLKALLFPSVWFQSQPSPFNFFWLMANTENSNFFTIVVFSKARIKIRTTMFSRFRGKNPGSRKSESGKIFNLIMPWKCQADFSFSSGISSSKCKDYNECCGTNVVHYNRNLSCLTFRLCICGYEACKN